MFYISFVVVAFYRAGGVVLGTDFTADLPAVHHRHHDVQQHQIGVQLVELGQGGRAVMDHRYVVAFLDQVQAEQFADIFIVIDDQNFLICHLGFLPKPPGGSL